MTIPFLDLKSAHSPLMGEFMEAIEKVIASSAFAGGPFVAEFEADWAAYCDSRHAIGVGNGTDALWLTLLALGVGPGDEVITVPNSFMATAEAITYCGARPVFVDVDASTYTMDPALLKEAITPRTKAIIPVHLFGQPADMDPILEIARGRGLPVVEDACQAHGATYKGRKAGSLGDAGCFSFYPGKNLGAFGEAGAVVTNSAALDEKIRVLRDHGQSRKYHHTMVGWNCRMDGIQAAVLRIKLQKLDRGNSLRRSHAERYGKAFAGADDIGTPSEAAYASHVFHIYPVRVRERDEVLRRLAAEGVGCGVHYPIPIHLQEAYRTLGIAKGTFPVAEQAASEFLSLPMFPALTAGQVDFAAQTLMNIVATSAALVASE
jgi:dTDP-4-amino-4,6-dideoxygalactose transaminase